MQAKTEADTRLDPFAVGKRAAVGATRGGRVESEHFVCFAACRPDGSLVACSGDVERQLFMRSSAKPLIAAVAVAGGAYERFGLTDVELAVATGSHSGEPYHVEAVRGMLRKIGLGEDALKCGAHPPLHAPSAAELTRAGVKPGAIHNNCSGKHAGILALAMHRGADPAGYLLPDHPAQVEILNGCAELLALARSEVAIGIDGCGIPAIAVGLRKAATFFAKLADPALFGAHWEPAVRRVRDAMRAHPDYVAGSARFDTTLMRVASGSVVCKGGAEGYHASAALEKRLGICVKVADGNPRATSPFVVGELQALGVLDEAQAAQLEAYRITPILNHAGTRVGDVRRI